MQNISSGTIYIANQTGVLLMTRRAPGKILTGCEQTCTYLLQNILHSIIPIVLEESNSLSKS